MPAPHSGGPGKLSSLEIDAPGLSVEAGLARRQRFRGRLDKAELELEQEALATWLAGPFGQRLRGRGVERIHVRLAPSVMALEALLLSGGRRVWLTARLRVARTVAEDTASNADARPVARNIALVVDRARVYGFTSTPAPLCALNLCVEILSGAAGSLPQADEVRTTPGTTTADTRGLWATRGFAAVHFDPLRLALLAVLPPLGYRLPDLDLQGAPLGSLRALDSRLVLTYGALTGAPGLVTDPALFRADPGLLAADALFAASQIDKAVVAYQDLADGPAPLAAQARSRLLAVLATLPAHFDEASALADQELVRSPDDPTAHLVLAAIATARDQGEIAAAHYIHMAGLLDNTPEEAATAALCAAELLLQSSPREATRWLDRAASLPGGPAATRAAGYLTEQYTRDRRFQELADLEERRLSMIPTTARGELQRHHLRLAGLYLEHLNDLPRAQGQIDQALALGETNPAAWELRARLLQSRAGHRAEALQALDRAAALSAPEDGAEILVRAGAFAERMGEEEAALSRYRRALDAVPGHLTALTRLADLLLGMGRLDEARESYEALLEKAPVGVNGNTLRRQALLALSHLAQEIANDRPRARGYLGRALALGGDQDPEVLRAWAASEEADGHLDNVDKALSRLEDLGFKDGMLRRAEVLVALQRPAEAIQVLDRLLLQQPEPSERPERETQALHILIAARQAMGDARGLRGALERFLRIAPDNQRANLELGQVLAAAGDLAGARQHLDRAGDDPAALEALILVAARQGDLAAQEEALGRLVKSLGAAGTVRSDAQAQALGRQAELLAGLGRGDEGLERLRQGLSLAPRSDEACVALGDAALALGQFAEAQAALAALLARLDQGAAEHKDDAALRRVLRLAELAQREHAPEAVGHFRRVLASQPSGPLVARAWGGLLQVLDEAAANPARITQDRGRDELTQALLDAAADLRSEETPAARAALLGRAADLRRRQGRLDEATALYEKALDLDPGFWPALDALEALAEHTGSDTQMAEALARKARVMTHRTAERKALLARLATLYAERLGKRDLARDTFRQVLALDPSFRPGLLFFAEDAHERGDFGAELAHLKRLASLTDGWEVEPVRRAEIHARLAQLHRRAGRHEEAERQARKTLEFQPDNLQALALLDERFNSTARWAELAEVLRRRTEVEPDAVERREALARRARVLDRELDQPAQALTAYRDLVRIDPDPEACNRLAALALLQEAFDEVQDVAPILGRSLLDAGRGAEAVPILEHAAHHGAGEPIFALLAEAYEAVGDSNKAADAWSAAGRTADPVRHARALEQADRSEEAMAAWMSLASSEPECSAQAHQAAIQLARRCIGQRPEEAMSWARRLLEVDPTDSQALSIVIGDAGQASQDLSALLDTLGRRLTQEEAAAAWAAAAQLLPDGQLEARRELLRRAVELGPTPERFLLLCALQHGAARLDLLRRGHAAFPDHAELTLHLVEAEEPDRAAAVLDEALSRQGLASADEQAHAGRQALLLGAARIHAARGEIGRARQLLDSAGPGEAALHARVQLDLALLADSDPHAEADLVPTLERLRETEKAYDEELLALARIYNARGQHAEAARVQLEAGGDPDDLLAALESAGKYPALLAALSAHATVRLTDARRLYRHAAHVAEHQVGDTRRAATFLEEAAFCQGREDEAAEIWSQAGQLWNQLGDRERGAGALGRALSAGGEATPMVLMALGDYFFDEGDWDTSARHYRRAFAVGQVPPAERGRVRLRLASVERRRGNAHAEEQELAAAVEAGSGATAWPALAALFRAQGESARLGAALLAWADHESGASRLALLKQAAGLVSASLLPRVDDELTKLDADDDEVRDRIQARHRLANDPRALAQALVRDIEKSEGERRASAARELAPLCEQLGDHAAAGSAWQVVLESSPEPGRDTQAILGWLSRARKLGPDQGGGALPADLIAQLRTLLIAEGRLDEAVAQIDHQIEALGDADPRGGERTFNTGNPGRLDLLREAAELLETLGDQEGAARRWLRVLSGPPHPALLSDLARARLSIGTLAAGGKPEAALQLVTTELRRLGTGGPKSPALRVVQAEVLSQVGKTDEAVGQLDLVLMRTPDFGPAHALLGQLLVHSQQPAEVERALHHLSRAAIAPDVKAAEAAECALLAADLILAGTASAATASEDEDEPPPADAASAQMERARALLGRAASLLPADLRPIKALYQLALAAGQTEQALTLLDSGIAIAEAPRDQVHLLIEKANLLRQIARPADAEKVLHEALRHDAGDAAVEATPALRQISVGLGDLPTARTLCLRELSLTQEPAVRAPLYLALGEIEDGLGDGDAATEAYRNAGQLGEVQGWQRLSLRLTEGEDFLGAADAAGRAAELTPEADRGEALLFAAELALRAQDDLRARDYLGLALALGGETARRAQQQLHELDGGPDPRERQQALLARLQTAEGLSRIDLLHRLLLIAVELADPAAILRYSDELLAVEPGDALAFRERKLVLEANQDTAGLLALWQQRAAALSDPAERAAALCQAAVLCQGPLGDLEQANQLLLAALELLPDHKPALLMLAEQCYRQGDYPRALRFYQSVDLLGGGAAGRPDEGELLLRYGELAEIQAAARPAAPPDRDDGNHGDAGADAERAYRQALNWSGRTAPPPSSGAGAMVGSGVGASARSPADQAALTVRAAEDLARLYQRRGDPAGALWALGHLIPYLPDGVSAEDVDRRVGVRLHLAWLSMQSGDPTEARRHLQYLLADRPAHVEGLTLLLEVHRQTGELVQAAEVLDRLFRLAATPVERADLLYERGVLFEAQLGDLDKAFDLYQQANEVSPGHAPALRRQVVGYLREANGVGVAEVVREMDETAQDLGEVQYLAGVGLALAGNDEHADRLLSSASADDLAIALCSIGLPSPGDLSILDEPIAAAVRTLGGTAALPRLEAALLARLQGAEFGLDIGARQILGRLAELRGEPAARVHLAVLAFLQPDGYASQRLEVLGPAPARMLTDDPMPSAGRGPLRDALAVLGRHVLGLPAPALPLSPEWGLRLRPLGHATGFPRLDVAVVDHLGDLSLGLTASQPGPPGALPGGDPARCDPTKPPRLRLLSRLTADSAQARFAALRALRLLVAGVPLIQGRSAEDVLSFLRAAARMFLPDVSASPHPLAQSWLARLQSLNLRPEALPREQREQAQTALRALLALIKEAPERIEAALPIFLESAQRAAERQALSETGDLLAALLALCEDPATDPRKRLNALRHSALAELIAFADRQSA